MTTLYDEVLVYGNPFVFDIVESHGLPARTSYMGYVLPLPLREPRTAAENSTPRVLVTGGGGRDLEALAKIVVTAQQILPLDRRPLVEILTGPYFPELAKQQLAHRQHQGIYLSESVPDARLRMREADLIVCQGGYNTVLEALSIGRMPVVLPRMPAKGVDVNLEQYKRTERFCELGLVKMIAAGEDPLPILIEILSGLDRREIDAMRPSRDGLSLVCQDGAATVADHLISMH